MINVIMTTAVLKGVDTADRSSGTHHDLSKGAGPEDFVDLVLLFLVGRRRLQHHLLGDEREHDDGEDDPVAVCRVNPIQISGRFLRDKS
jgi:hypothetical protein